MKIVIEPELKYDFEKTRTIYTITIDEKVYIIKISLIDIDTRENGFDNEIDCYQILTNPESPSILRDHVARYINSVRRLHGTLLTIDIEGVCVSLDFKDWYLALVKNTNMDSFVANVFRVLVIEKAIGYTPVWSILLDSEKQFLVTILKKTMEVLYIANQSYNFVHGDLTPFNILVNKKGSIKIIDFDYSTINNTPSYSVINFDELYPLNGKKGFLWDFYRINIQLLQGLGDNMIRTLLHYSQKYNYNDTTCFNKWVRTLSNRTLETTQRKISLADKQHLLQKHPLYFQKESSIMRYTLQLEGKIRVWLCDIYKDFLSSGKNIDLEAIDYTFLFLYEKIKQHNNIIDRTTLQGMVYASFKLSLRHMDCDTEATFEELSYLTDDGASPATIVKMYEDMTSIQIEPKIDRLYAHLQKVLDLEFLFLL